MNRATISIALALTLSLGIVGPQAASVAQAATQRISERTYQQLAQVHALMQKQRYDEALADLDRLRARVGNRANEHALVLQTYGHLYTAQEQYPEAIAALSECLALEALPRAATAATLYLLAQLHMAAGDYAAAVKTLEHWFALGAEPAPTARAMAGSAYARLQRYPEAAEQLVKAIDASPKPEENWYRELLAVRYQARDYTAAAGLLQRMLELFPERKEYWLQLAGVYAETGKQAQSVAVLELAYLRGLLSAEPELLNLARHYLFAGLPHKAATLLEGALENGALDATPGNWNLLIDAWLRARETTRALAAVERALVSLTDAELHLRHARLLAETENWPAVIDATAQALASDELSARGTAHLLAGMAAFQLQRAREARSHFEHAREFDHSRQQAEQWLQHLATTTQRP